MTPTSLKQHIAALPDDAPVTARFERALTRQGCWDRSQVWYSSQKQRWLGWLSEYGGPGYYGRKVGRVRSAEFVYNHIVCPPMLLWLAEAAGVSRSTVVTAKNAALAAAPSLPTKCAAIRRVIPFQMVANLL